jgi:hypothetical protein
MNVYEYKNDFIAKLVNITAISLGFIGDIFPVNGAYKHGWQTNKWDLSEQVLPTKMGDKR